MINTEIRQFREAILGVAQASPLPIEVKRLVLAEVLTAANKESDAEIQNEITLLKAQEEKQNKDIEESEEKENE